MPRRFITRPCLPALAPPPLDRLLMPATTSPTDELLTPSTSPGDLATPSDASTSIKPTTPPPIHHELPARVPEQTDERETDHTVRISIHPSISGWSLSDTLGLRTPFTTVTPSPSLDAPNPATSPDATPRVSGHKRRAATLALAHAENDAAERAALASHAQLSPTDRAVLSRPFQSVYLEVCERDVSPLQADDAEAYDGSSLGGGWGDAPSLTDGSSCASSNSGSSAGEEDWGWGGDGSRSESCLSISSSESGEGEVVARVRRGEFAPGLPRIADVISPSVEGLPSIENSLPLAKDADPKDLNDETVKFGHQLANGFAPLRRFSSTSSVSASPTGLAGLGVPIPFPAPGRGRALERREHPVCVGFALVDEPVRSSMAGGDGRALRAVGDADADAGLAGAKMGMDADEDKTPRPPPPPEYEHKHDHPSLPSFRPVFTSRPRSRPLPNPPTSGILPSLTSTNTITRAPSTASERSTPASFDSGLDADIESNSSDSDAGADDASPLFNGADDAEGALAATSPCSSVQSAEAKSEKGKEDHHGGDKDLRSSSSEGDCPAEQELEEEDDYLTPLTLPSVLEAQLAALYRIASPSLPSASPLSSPTSPISPTTLCSTASPRVLAVRTKTKKDSIRMGGIPRRTLSQFLRAEWDGRVVFTHSPPMRSPDSGSSPDLELERRMTPHALPALLEEQLSELDGDVGTRSGSSMRGASSPGAGAQRRTLSDFVRDEWDERIVFALDSPPSTVPTSRASSDEGYPVTTRDRSSEEGKATAAAAAAGSSADSEEFEFDLSPYLECGSDSPQDAGEDRGVRSLLQPSDEALCSTGSSFSRPLPFLGSSSEYTRCIPPSPTAIASRPAPAGASSPCLYAFTQAYSNASIIKH